MRIKNYNKIKNTEKFVKTITELGFKKKKRPNARHTGKEWCWEHGGGTGNSAPEIFIYEDPDNPYDGENGKLMMYMTSVWYYRDVPDVVFELANRGLLDIKLKKESKLREVNV